MSTSTAVTLAASWKFPIYVPSQGVTLLVPTIPQEALIGTAEASDSTRCTASAHVSRQQRGGLSLSLSAGAGAQASLLVVAQPWDGCWSTAGVCA